MSVGGVIYTFEKTLYGFGQSAAGNPSKLKATGVVADDELGGFYSSGISTFGLALHNDKNLIAATTENDLTASNSGGWYYFS